MGNVGNLKRIVKEDFDKEDQALVEKIAFVYNPLAEQLTSVFNKGIDFDNLNQQFTQVTLQVDANGVPTMKAEIKYQLKTRIKGTQCLRAENLTDTTPLTGAPFITFVMKADLVQITHITGLVPGKDYRLSLIFVG